MKRIYFLVFILLILLFGCEESTKFSPNIKQVTHTIEVNTQYDALSFIRDLSNDDYTIEVIDNPIDISKVGNYNVTFRISDNNDNSMDLTYLIAVVDKTKPIIQLIADITTTVNREFNINNFVQVTDNCDTNLTNQLEVIGEYDITKAGEYQIQLQVTDSSNNTTTKTVTVYVLEDEQTNNSSNSLAGIYKVHYTEEDELNPYLVLSNDETYSLVINYCVGLRTFTGTYTVNGNHIILESDSLTFDDDDPSSNTITLVINEDGSLTYSNSYGACSPLRNDIFVKQ